MLRLAALPLALALLLVTAASALAGTPEQDLESINRLRGGNGIPGDIVLNPDWSAKCAQHVTYMKATQTVTHEENSASPYYTDGGNWAGTHSVLASTVPWTPTTFIWETAPLHIAQLLAPGLAQVGIADDGQFVCVTTWPGYTRPLPPTDSVLTYPGQGSRIYASMVTEEWPITPAQALGIPNPTGPHLYVYEWGPSAVSGLTATGDTIRIAQASLRGPAGPVPVRWIDNTNAALGRYLVPASGIIVPVRPLGLGVSYRASVQFSNGVEHAWTFSTGNVGNLATLRGLKIVPQQLARRVTCVEGTAADCQRWALSYVSTVRITGRFTEARKPDRGIPGSFVGIVVRGIEQALVRTGAQGQFAATYRFAARTRTFKMTISLRDGAPFGSYVVTFRLTKRGTGSTAEILRIDPAPITYATPPSRPRS
jgi:hypothetical protein